ncbi:MAG: MBL fold metallo-hydrolase, partial [Verrucomicrobia bacterium]
MLSDETIAEVNARGGIRAIAISHPHFYSSMIEWADRFDAQIFLHAADREWVMRKSRRIQFWEGSTLSLWDRLTLINLGGHFEGGTVLHWPAESRDGGSKGALLAGDIITVVQDRRYVSFMRSYPNIIPLG